ncbi:hypothetical protein SAMN05216315_13729 [Nitrosospira sp. Nsp18]|nr:hypothetical protein SAMN05216315_13729 [Nitrosospira sp. Nsp18]
MACSLTRLSDRHGAQACRVAERHPIPYAPRILLVPAEAMATVLCPYPRFKVSSASIGLSDFSPVLMLDEQTPAYESRRFSAIHTPAIW